MNDNTASRKWQVTINNPVEKGYTHERIQEIMQEFKNCVYWCMSDETGENGTFHTHIYIACTGAVRFSTMLRRFEGGHFEMAKGTSEQNRDYVFKQGKWQGSEKETTNHTDSHYEYGVMPVERQGKRNDLDDLYDMIKAGMTDFDILEDNPTYMLNIDKIEHCRQIVREEKYKDCWRDLDVTYIFGLTGSGKTRSVMEEYGYSNCYRVTDYAHPFDGYKGQDVVIFEEFRSDLTLSDMLKYLDGYPVELPCRYRNKVACFTKVFIISNIALEEQYPNKQREEKECYNALIRRIHHVVEYDEMGVHAYPTEAYLYGFRYCITIPKELAGVV